MSSLQLLSNQRSDYLARMANPRLTPDQLDFTRALLDEVRAKLVELSGGD